MIMMMILRVLPLTPFYPLLSAQSGDKMNDFNSDEDDTVTTTHDDARGSFMCARSFSSFTSAWISLSSSRALFWRARNPLTNILYLNKINLGLVKC